MKTLIDGGKDGGNGGDDIGGLFYRSYKTLSKRHQGNGRNPDFGGGHTPKTLFVSSNSLGVGNFQNLHFWAKSALELINTQVPILTTI